MKKCILIGLTILIPLIAWGQEKANTIKVGAGFIISKADLFKSNIDSDRWSNTAFGPSLAIEYSRLFEPWLTVSSALCLSNADMKNHSAINSAAIKDVESYQIINHYSWNIQALFRPFFKNDLLNKIEIGGGIQTELFNEKYFECAGTLGSGTALFYSYFNNNKIYPGIIASGSIHIIENIQFDLSLRYTYNLLKINVERDAVYNYYNYMSLHVLFGIKF